MTVSLQIVYDINDHIILDPKFTQLGENIINWLVWDI